MNYQETIDYLFNAAPLFQHIGKEAYKEGLYNTRELDAHFNHPHREFSTIHVAGTNGKGSCSHTLAAILQSAGYKVGLYTSPHLIDFRERIRINGVPMPEQFLIEFVAQERVFFEPLHPSFFELTTALAFRYFAEERVDVAVIEVGLGGRLDCTNIITPDLAIITNISLDHTQFLGTTLAQIATEKAGIIKPGIPTVIGETTPETKAVFIQKGVEQGSPLIFAEENPRIQSGHVCDDGGYDYATTQGNIHGELGGLCQEKNSNTILTAIEELQKKGYHIQVRDIKEGFAQVCKLTGLRGRWQQLNKAPRTFCDTGHNVAGITYITQQLKLQTYNRLRIVIGVVNDKDVTGILELLPHDAVYYFTQATVKRALPATELKELAATLNLHGSTYPTVSEAYEAARSEANPDDFIFIGGSSFIVADLLTYTM